MQTPMIKALLVLIIFPLALLSCKDKQEYSVGGDDYNHQTEKLAETEMKFPKKFLSVKSSDKKNILGQTVVRGVITNNAKVAAYKDIDIKLRFYSKTAVLLEEDVETIYENLGPGETTKFKSKYFSPKGSDSVSITIEGVKAAQ